jgi:integrase
MRLRYVQAFVDRKTGVAFHYFRRRNQPIAIGAKRTKAGSINAAIVGYYQSRTFAELAPGTKAMRRAIYERLRAAHGDMPIDMPAKFINITIDKMKPHAARNWFKAIRALMAYAVKADLIAINPTAGIKTPPVKSEGVHAWTEAEIAQYEAHHAIGTKPRLAFALALYTGQRRGDLVRLGRQHIRNGAIEIRQQKTGSVLQIPLHAELLKILGRPKVTEEVRQKIWDGFELGKSQAWIAEELGLSQGTVSRYLVGDRAGAGSSRLLFLTTKTGKPYSPNDLSDEFRVWCDAAGLPAECSLHGLRKAAARRLAEAGCSTHEIAAITGHKTLKEVERYTKSAEQARLARQAMAKLLENA